MLACSVWGSSGYRTQRKRDEEQIAAAGGSTARAERLRREADAMLEQIALGMCPGGMPGWARIGDSKRL